MQIEMTPFEAEILIGVLTGAEGSFAVTNPALVEALAALRPWRTALVQAYLRERIETFRAQPTTEASVGAPSHE